MSRCARRSAPYVAFPGILVALACQPASEPEVAGQSVATGPFLRVERTAAADPGTNLTAAQHLPERFRVVAGAPAGAQGPGHCAQRLADADGTELELVQQTRLTSTEPAGDTTWVIHRTSGDYLPSSWERYGLEEHQALRVDCAGHTPLGAVELRGPDGKGGVRETPRPPRP